MELEANFLPCRVFVISLPDSCRRQRVSEHLDSLGIKFSFFDAFRGRVDLKNPENFRVELSNGEVGCWRSHLGIFQKVLEEKIQVALVLEDDFCIQDKTLLLRQVTLFQQIYNADKGLKWDWIKLFQVNKIRAFRPVLREDDITLSVPFKRGFSSMAYLISNQGASRFLEGYLKNSQRNPIYEGIDRYLDNTHRSKVSLFISDLNAIGESIDMQASQISDRAGELRSKIKKLLDSLGMRMAAWKTWTLAKMSLRNF